MGPASECGMTDVGEYVAVYVGVYVAVYVGLSVAVYVGVFMVVSVYGYVLYRECMVR